MTQTRCEATSEEEIEETGEGVVVNTAAVDAAAEHGEAATAAAAT
jgi:hypothetical protein